MNNIILTRMAARCPVSQIFGKCCARFLCWTGIHIRPEAPMNNVRGARVYLDNQTSTPCDSRVVVVKPWVWRSFF